MAYFSRAAVRAASLVTIVALLSLGLTASASDRRDARMSETNDWSFRLGQDVSTSLGVAGARIVDIARPAAKAGSPDAMVVSSVPVAGGTVDFSLRAFDVFTPDAHLVAVHDGVETPIARPTSHLYSGRSVDGLGTMFMAVDGDQYQAWVTYGGETCYMLPLEGSSKHVIAPAASMKLPAPAPTEYCGADFVPENQEFLANWDEAKVTKAAKTANAGLLQADVMLDVSNSLYVSVFGSNTTTTTNYVNSLIGAVSAIYERDINVRLRISSFTIWTSADPFTGANSSAQLNSYVTWARANRTAVVRDYGHLLLNGNVTNYGGIAYLGVLCNTQFGYGLTNIYGHASFPTPSYYWDMDATSHEMGHNFGSPHTHCYSPPIDMCYNAESGCYSGPVIATTGTIMSYCHLTSAGKVLIFSSREIDVIRGGATSASCLSPVADVPWDTPGVYNPSTAAFFLRNQQTGGGADVTLIYGPAGVGWVPLVGDWDGNGTDTVGLYVPSNGFFYLKNSNTPGPADIVFGYGPAGVNIKPLVGDWNGDGIDTIGIYNTSTGVFFLKNTNNYGVADIAFGFGPPGLVPVVGDWNGDGIDTVGVYNPTTGFFFLRNYHLPGGADITVGFGAANFGYIPLAGDWNGDSLTTIGLYSPASGQFFFRNTNTPGVADVTVGFGPPNLSPVVGNWDGH